LCLLTQLGVGSDFREWKPRVSLALNSKPSVIEYSPDGKLLAVGDTEGLITLVDALAGAIVHTIQTDLQPVLIVNFLEKSNRLLVCGGDLIVRILSISEWKSTGEATGIADCSASPDEKLLVGRSKDEAVVLWDLEQLKPRQQLMKKGARPRDPRFVERGKFVTVSVGHVPYRIEIASGEQTEIRQSTDKKTAVNIEKLQENQVAISLGAFQDDDAPTHRAIPSRDGSLLALGRGWFGQADFVDVWDLTKLNRIARFKYKGSGTDSSFSSDNRLVAISSSKPGTITIFRMSDRKKTEVKGSEIFQFSPKGIDLAVVDGRQLLIYAPK